MDVKEMREALCRMCEDVEPHDCLNGTCELEPHCKIFECDFDNAPDEMIYKWYAIAFPKNRTNSGLSKALADVVNACKPINIPNLNTLAIKDSGHRREFETGAVRDMMGGKGRMDLLPWAAIMEVSRHCENGAQKYGEHNIDLGIPTSSLCDSAARHLAKYLDGWTDEPHLLAATWNLLWAVQMTIKNPNMVDTPWRNENGQA